MGGVAQNGHSSDAYNTGFIYLESIRERELLPFWPRWKEEHVIAHELGHQGGSPNDHSDGGIMGAPMDMGGLAGGEGLLQ